MSIAIRDFTTAIPFWQPYITPIDLDTASSEQLESIKVTPSHTKVSEYVLVLAHDPESLQHRTPLFNGIMYSHGGLERAELELSAVGASVVNRCIYCVAVHSSRYNQLTKTESVMEQIFADGEDATLEPRQGAIFKFSTKLAKYPSEITQHDMQALDSVGLTEAEILDLILSSALFAWANRLMHTLGEPIVAEKTD